jgi:hypothetical protein
MLLPSYSGFADIKSGNTDGISALIAQAKN